MSAGAPVLGLGSILEFASVAQPTQFTTLGGYHDGGFSGNKIATDKTTASNSTNGVETYIGGLEEPGSFDAKCFFLPGDASQIALEAIKVGRTAVNFKYIMKNPDGTAITGGTASFLGIVEQMERKFPIDKTATLDVKVKVTGPITWT